MSNYKEQIDKISKQILRKLAKEQNIILIGENSTGKSDVLRNIVTNLLKEEKSVYFIDAVNRVFDISKVTFNAPSRNESGHLLMDGSWKINGKYAVGAFLSDNIEKIAATRLREDRFNLVDSFGDLSFPIEDLYADFKERIQELSEKLLEDKIEIKQEMSKETGRVQHVLVINNNKVLLSNGYQAILRILLELLYYQEIVKNKNIEHPIVIIDELDKYLSPGYSAKIFPFLQEEFSEFIFCMTTHSRDVMKYAQDYLLCPLQQDDSGNVHHEFISSEDIKNDKKIETIFSDLFFKKEREATSSNDEIDTLLRRFLNLKLTDSWDGECQREFESLKQEKLAPHQLLLCRQIEEW